MNYSKWRVSRAFDKIGSGTTPKSGVSEYYDGGTDNWLVTGDLNDNEINETSKKITKKALADYSTLKLYPSGSLVIAMYGATIGKIGLLKIPTTVNQACCVLSPSKRVLPKYAYYYFLSSKQQLIDLATGGGQPNINQDIIRSFSINLPDTDVQSDIVKYLDNKISILDKMITAKKRIHDELIELRSAIITNAILGRDNENCGFQETNIPWIGKIPKNWDIGRIKTIASVKRGASPRPIDDPKYFDEDGEYAWVRISDVTRQSKYLRDAPQKLSRLGKSLSVPLEPGELFLSIAASVGKPMISAIKCCIHDGFIYFKNPTINREYLFFIFEAGEAYKGLGKLGTQLNLNSETVGEMRIPIPSREEQDYIVAKLNVKLKIFDESLEKLDITTKLYEEYRLSLISNAVNGNINL